MSIQQQIVKATDNRMRCKYCGRTILKDEKYFRDALQKWDYSHTVNICSNCISELAKKIGGKKK